MHFGGMTGMHCTSYSRVTSSTAVCLALAVLYLHFCSGLVSVAELGTVVHERDWFID